jgi:hypothetical protein
MRSSEFCLGHDPDKADERRRRASKGGKRGGRGRPLTELAGLKTRLSDLADDVLAGNVNRASAAVAGQLLNTIIRAVSVELKVREQQDLIERLEELEALQEGRDEGGWHRGVSG